jgi:hypothetical protein
MLGRPGKHPAKSPKKRRAPQAGRDALLLEARPNQGWLRCFDRCLFISNIDTFLLPPKIF